MKKIFILSVLFVFLKLNMQAQFTEHGIVPAATAPPEQFTEWKKVEFSIDGENLSYEYRIAFMKRKALACYYEMQLKNTSAKKLKVKVDSHYTDKMLKQQFGDKFEEDVKPEKEVSFLILVQGCKADKDKKDQPDNERCAGSEMFYNIVTSLK